jgi:hypothetical protein
MPQRYIANVLKSKPTRKSVRCLAPPSSLGVHADPGPVAAHRTVTGREPAATFSKQVTQITRTREQTLRSERYQVSDGIVLL